MGNKILNDMCEKIPNMHPEDWLIKKEFHNLIAAKVYQTQLSFDYNVQHPYDVQQPPYQHWSRALSIVYTWFNTMLKDGFLNNIKGKNWVTELDNETDRMLQVHPGTRRDEIRDCMIFWIVKYSLEKAISNNTIILNDGALRGTP